MQVFAFDADLNIGDTNIKRSLLGGKGANLNTMQVELGMPVPPGFTITTDACFIHDGRSTVDPMLRSKVTKQVAKLEQATDKKFGAAAKMPLLLSVRSGAPVSMPGMMDTLLNLGLNDKSVRALAKRTNERFAYDSYRRFIQMFSTIVYGVDAKEFSRIDKAVEEFFEGLDVAERHEMAIERYTKKLDSLGVPQVPQDVNEQLDAAILAVFESWNSDRAKSYREIEGIPHDLGTAVNVQAMVFGNLNDNSGTGVAFTRNPNNGANERFGDFLVNAQGEDVVAGLAQTLPLSDMTGIFPEQAAELEEIMVRLEAHYKDMCDIEFTIEDGKLYMLQTRTGKRNSKAGVAIAFDLFAEGVIDRDEAISRIDGAASSGGPVVQNVTESDSDRVLGKGTPASPGIVQGRAVFTSAAAVEAKANGEDVILVREETSPDDIDGMHAAIGILTQVGGLVSHAAVVARAWEKPCVVGFPFDEVCDRERAAVIIIDDNRVYVREDDTIRIDGATGTVTLCS